MKQARQNNGSSVHGFRSALYSEWLKMWTVPSTFVSIIAAFVGIVGISVLICWLYLRNVGNLTPTQAIGFDPAFLSVSGVFVAQIAIGVLGVLVVGSEHSTGLIRTSLVSNPHRLSLLSAKAVVFTVVTFCVSFCGAIVGFLSGQAVFSTGEIGVSIGHAGVWRVIVGAALYLSVLGLLAVGIGTIVRRTPGALVAFFSILLVLPVVAAFLPAPWNSNLNKFLPVQAGLVLLRTMASHDALAPWTGFGLLCGYAAIVLGVAAMLFVRRDA